MSTKKKIVILVPVVVLILAGVVLAMRRGDPGLPEDVFIRSISNGTDVSLEDEEVLKQIPYTDFYFVVDFATRGTIQMGNQQNTVHVYLENRSVAPHKWIDDWIHTTVRVYAQQGTLEDWQGDSFFPEDNPANEVATQIEMLSEDSIKVSPVAGTFPSGCQVVLMLDYGGKGSRLYRVFTWTHG